MPCSIEAEFSTLTFNPWSGRVSGLAAMALLATPHPLLAAEAGGEPNAWLWNLVVVLVVLVFALASAVLPLAAWRQWSGRWRSAAGFPLLVLALWIVAIVAGRLGNPGSHELWPLEIFAWSMLNMIYMVAVMTTKRTLDRADAEDSGSV